MDKNYPQIHQPRSGIDFATLADGFSYILNTSATSKERLAKND